MRTIRAVVFDCFGVIITDVLRPIMVELRQSDPAAAQELSGLVTARNRGEVSSNVSNQRISELLGMQQGDWRQYVDHHAVKDKRLLAYILELRGRNYKTALLSNVGSQSLERRFLAEELRAHFDKVVASHEVGMVKPDPGIYLHTAEKLGVRPDECVFTDDREEHCKGAEAVGMKAIWYKDFAQFKEDLEVLLDN